MIENHNINQTDCPTDYDAQWEYLSGCLIEYVGLPPNQVHHYLPENWVEMVLGTAPDETAIV